MLSHIARQRPGIVIHSRQPPRRRNALLLAVILPFWISFLLRVYAWIGLLNTKGVINSVLLWTGLISEPLQLMYNDFAVYLGIGLRRARAKESADNLFASGRVLITVALLIVVMLFLTVVDLPWLEKLTTPHYIHLPGD